MRRWVGLTVVGVLALSTAAPAAGVPGSDGPMAGTVTAEAVVGLPTGATVAVGRDGDDVVVVARDDDVPAGLAAQAVPTLGAATGGPALQAGSDPPGLPQLGEHPVVVAVGTIGAQVPDGVTTADLATEVDTDVAAYWSDSTDGWLSFAVTDSVDAGSYTGWGSADTCTDAQVVGFLDHAADALGLSAPSDTGGVHGVMYTPELAACEFASISYLGDGGVVWVNGARGSRLRWVTIAHELGHTLTLGDSDTRAACALDADDEPTASDGTSGGCVDGVQGDAYDVMGFQTAGLPGPLNGAHLQALGVLTADNARYVSGPGTVDLEPVGGLTGVRFAWFETNFATYYVEYRSAVGRDADLVTDRAGCPFGVEDCSVQGSYVPGVLVRRVDKAEPGASSYLLDAAVGDPDLDYASSDWWVLPTGYTFTTANRVVSIDVLSADEGGAQVRFTMPGTPIDQIVATRDLTGDGKADVFAVDTVGTLYLYPGTGTGKLGTIRKIGPGWGTMRVFAPGDWNTDGRADLVAADAAGDLWLYPGKGNGTFASRVKIGNGWNGYRIVPAGDMNGDGRADLLAIDPQGRLWLYPGAGLGKFGRRVQVGNGWIGFDLYAAGDANRDGRQDILSIDSGGRLWYYAGRGGGFFAQRRQVGWGWSGYEFASGADLNRDGYGDLLGRDPSGRLWFYPGRYGGTFGAKSTIATGW